MLTLPRFLIYDNTFLSGYMLHVLPENEFYSEHVSFCIIPVCRVHKMLTILMVAEIRYIANMYYTPKGVNGYMEW